MKKFESRSLEIQLREFGLNKIILEIKSDYLEIKSDYLRIKRDYLGIKSDYFIKRYSGLKRSLQRDYNGQSGDEPEFGFRSNLMDRKRVFALEKYFLHVP